MSSGNAWKWVAIILIVVLVVLVIGLLLGWFDAWLCPKPPPYEEPTAHRIEANLHDVQITGGAPRRFQLYNWYRDQHDSIMYGRFAPTVWTFQAGSSGAVGSVDRGLVEVSTFTTGGPKPASVQLSSPLSGVLSDNISLTLWGSVSDVGPSTVDVVEAPYDAEQPPSALLVEEKSGSVCQWWNVPTAFVRAAAVKQQTNTPCSLAYLSANHALLFEDPPSAAQWPTTTHKITIGPLSPHFLQDPLQLNVDVYIAVTGRTASALSGIPLSNTDALTADVAEAALAQAKEDIAWANVIYQANRVGITLVPTYHTRISAYTLLNVGLSGDDIEKTVGADPVSCAQPRNLAAVGLYNPNTISIYYVDWIAYPSDPLYAVRGMRCEPDILINAGPVIFISFTRHSTTSLAHEIGHTFWGDLHPQPADLGKLLPLNVMYGNIPDGALGADARSHLTVGQAFWANVSNLSWVNLSGARSGPTRGCVGMACPPIYTVDVH